MKNGDCQGQIFYPILTQLKHFFAHHYIHNFIFELLENPEYADMQQTYDTLTSFDMTMKSGVEVRPGCGRCATVNILFFPPVGIWYVRKDFPR